MVPLLGLFSHVPRCEFWMCSFILIFLLSIFKCRVEPSFQSISFETRVLPFFHLSFDTNQGGWTFEHLKDPPLKDLFT